MDGRLDKINGWLALDYVYPCSSRHTIPNCTSRQCPVEESILDYARENLVMFNIFIKVFKCIMKSRVHFSSKSFSVSPLRTPTRSAFRRTRRSPSPPTSPTLAAWEVVCDCYVCCFIYNQNKPRMAFLTLIPVHSFTFWPGFFLVLYTLSTLRPFLGCENAAGKLRQ